jgi:site-specific DNA-methyltransferase (adenine-specific)
MKPYFQDSHCTIYHGDCREILPILQPVDLLLTDPPYGINIAANPFRQKFEKSKWDVLPVADDLLLLSMGLVKESIIWGGNYFNLFPSQGFLIWDKLQPEDFTSSQVECAFWSEKTPAKIFKTSVTNYRKHHPTQKPVDLMKWCILKAKCNPLSILDPFMGSGSTLRAAKDLNRKAIGIELEEKYCEIAAKRLSQEVLPL